MTSFEGIFETKGPEETAALGERLGAGLTGGEVVALYGELGTGKTTFIRGLARGLGVKDPDRVHSPSYTLMLLYEGAPSLLHLDAYFMKSLEDLDLCGLEDARERGDVVALEWGDRVEGRLPSDRIEVRIQHLAPERRRLEIHRIHGNHQQG